MAEKRKHDEPAEYYPAGSGASGERQYVYESYEGGYEAKRRRICMTCELYDEGFCFENSHRGSHLETDSCGSWKESYGFYANCIDISSEEALNNFRRPYMTLEEAKTILSGCL